VNVGGDYGAGRAGRLAFVAALVLLAGLLGASSTRADELAYRGCTASDPELGPSGSGACTQIPGSGFAAVHSVALSPDGKSLYAAGDEYTCSGSDCRLVSAIARFDRDPATGALAYRGCITGTKNQDPSDSRACDEIPSATESGRGSGLSGLRDVTVSPDGKSVYAVALYAVGISFEDPSLARFDRHPATGALTWRGCITGATDLGPSGTGACDEIPSATEDGTNSGIGDPTAVAVSPDGNSLYVTSGATGYGSQDAAVARFDRAPDTRALTWRGCISGNTALGPSGNGACALIPSASPDAEDSGLSPVSLSLSPDGASLYTGSLYACYEGYCNYGSRGLARFDHNPATGALTWRGCITGDKQSGPSGSGACTQIPSATDDGGGSGLTEATLAASPDGRSLYAGGASKVARLDRDPATGTLAYRGCITSDKYGAGPSTRAACALTPGATAYGRYSDLNGVQALAASPNGKALYVGAENKVIRLGRDPATGALRFRDCVTGDTLSGPSGSGACRAIRGATVTGHGSGLGRWDISLAASEDGESLYMASGRPYRIARLGLAPQTRMTKGRTGGHRAVLHFRAGERSTFECKLKGKRVRPRLRHWRHCGSKAPGHRGVERYRKLRPGRKVFRVRATDKAGNTDPTPAKRRWRVR
jgi:DNA-binding beta-propeller fold protein YncE